MYLTSTMIETRPTMNASEFTNYELEFHRHNRYIPIEKIRDILGERDDATNIEPILEADNVQTGDDMGK